MADDLAKDKEVVESSVEDMLHCIMRTLPDATAAQIGQDLVAEVKKAFKEAKAPQEVKKGEADGDEAAPLMAESKEDDSKEEEDEKPPGSHTLRVSPHPIASWNEVTGRVTDASPALPCAVFCRRR